MALPAIILGAMGRVGVASAVSGGASGAATGAVAGRAAASGLAQITNAVSTLGNVSQQASPKIHGLVNLVGAATGQLTQALTLWIGAVQSAAAPIESMVAVANPAKAEAFSRAMRDAYGVVGRLLIPVMDSFTTVARKVGNVMAGLEPVAKPMIAAVSKLVDTIGTEFTQMVKENVPVFELMASVLTKVVENVTTAVKVLGELWRTFNKIGQTIARILGFKGDSFDPKASSQGAAARQAQFVQPKQIADDMIRNALMVGIGGKDTSEKGALNRIDTNIDSILTWLREKGEELRQARDKVVDRAEKVRDAAGYVSPAFALQRWAASKVF